MSSPSSQPSSHPSRWAWPVGLIITAAFLAWALHGVDLKEVVAGARRANLWLVVLSAMVATLTFPIRAIRWRVLLRDVHEKPFAVGPLWDATAIGFMANNLLPARAGEFARAWVASRRLPVRFSTALASIGVERVFDGLMMLALMAVAIAAPSFPSQARVGDTSLSRIAAFAAAVFGTLLLVALLVALRPGPWLALLDRVTGALLPTRWAGKVRSAAEGLVAGLAVLKNPVRFVMVVFWSLVLWLVNAAAFAICFRAFDLLVPPEGSLLLQGLIGFGVAIPSAPGYAGVFEAATILTLQFYGIGAGAALAYAVVFHLAGFIPITLLGLQALSRANLRLGDLRRSAQEPAT